MLGRPVSSWIVAGVAAFTLAAASHIIDNAAAGDTMATALVGLMVASGVLALVPTRWAAITVAAWVTVDCAMSLAWISGSRAYVLARFAGVVLRSAVLLACAYHIWTTLSERRA